MIQKTQHFKDIYEREREEMMRLLYVGVTRARDCLIITGSQGSFRGNPTGTPLSRQTWLSSLGFNVESILGHEGKLPWVDMPHVETGATAENMPETVRVFAPNPSDEERLPRFLSPSMSRMDVNPQLELVCTADKTIVPNVSDKSMMSTIGTCIHNIFAAEAKANVAAETIAAFGLQKELPTAGDITASWQWLTEQLTSLHGKQVKVCHELPFEFLADNGQTVRGEMDLLWETADGIVLIDFKTHLGKTEDGEGDEDLMKDIISRRYPSQLALYTEALQRAGKKVLAQYLFFPISGQLVEVKY